MAVEPYESDCVEEKILWKLITICVMLKYTILCRDTMHVTVVDLAVFFFFFLVHVNQPF